LAIIYEETGNTAMTSMLKTLGASTAIAAILMTSVPVYASTDPGVSILNNVTVDYQVGTVAQTQKTASDTFVVDRKVLFTVVEKTTAGLTTSVSPGQLGAITAFTVTNSSNDVLDFTLGASNLATAATTPRGTDAIDVSNLLMCFDTDNDGACNGAASATLTIDNLAKDGGNVTVLVLGDVALTATTGQIAGVRLTATALTSAGGAITASLDTDVNNAAAVETIFADDLTPLLGNASRNGSSWAHDDYTVSAALLTVFKSSKVISDGVSTSNFKSIPGAVVEYCISVANAAGSATATNVNVGDLIPANTTFVAGSIKLNATVTTPGASQVCSGGTAGGTYATSPAPKASGTLSSIAGGNASALVFQVTID
jgi:uncharacterized repeat protein (TIGR01451 family)